MIISKSRTFRLISALSTLFVLNACSDKVDEPEAGSRQWLTAQANASYRRLNVNITKRTVDSAAQTTAALMAIIAGADVNKSDVVAEVRGSSDIGVVSLADSKNPRLNAHYFPDTDTFDVSDLDLATVRDGAEVSESEARAVANSVLDSLVARGVTTSGAFRMADAEVSTMVQGVGDSSGSPPKESTKEYRFFIPKRLDGVIVNDGGQRDLGVRISIHRSGRVKGIKFTGLSASAGPAALTPVAQRVDSDDIDARVAAEYPGAVIMPVGLRYSTNSSGSEPRQVYRVSQTSIKEGETVHSRALTVYYSVTDSSAPAEIWPQPNIDDVTTQSDRKPR